MTAKKATPADKAKKPESKPDEKPDDAGAGDPASRSIVRNR